MGQRIARMQRRAAAASIRKYTTENAAGIRDGIIEQMAARRRARRLQVAFLVTVPVVAVAVVVAVLTGLVP